MHEGFHLDPLHWICLISSDKEREEDFDCLLVTSGGPDGVHYCLSALPGVLDPGMSEFDSKGELGSCCSCC